MEYNLYRYIDDNSNILYVGKTLQPVSRRLDQHITEEAQYAIGNAHIEIAIVGSKADMALYEIYYINKYLPKYNICQKSNIPFVEMPELQWKPYTLQRHTKSPTRFRFKTETKPYDIKPEYSVNKENIKIAIAIIDILANIGKKKHSHIISYVINNKIGSFKDNYTKYSTAVIRTSGIPNYDFIGASSALYLVNASCNFVLQIRCDDDNNIHINYNADEIEMARAFLEYLFTAEDDTISFIHNLGSTARYKRIAPVVNE